ncbi:protein adenylyltransferase SelO [Paenibacillus xanthanilyticus]|uniref:Protein nucleotidyltransferase YdiU n=1 Tax=Paenibacillus xanthanilyticus TaxID=1783531 RepID=A0ABV8K5X3_9BACL
MTATNETLAAGWNFDNSYARLPDAFYSKQQLNPVEAPALVVLNGPLAASLGLNEEQLRSEAAIEVFAGNRAPDGAEPLAQAYAGHQFGHLNMLGDGRALLLGEQITPAGERFDIQLKGSGRTPYSRGGDGRAALGPMLREYIISEAMHGLGIPTTRSLAVAATGESIQRGEELPGAVLTRVASSHIRVGTFVYAAGALSGEHLAAMADYTIERHYPQAANAENRYLALLEGVAARQASLIAKWQLVGFIHGVMNTDNMALSGETIDYGPCAFMDVYDPATVFSSIDTQGRYAYGQQPKIGAWNLARFAETLLPLLHDEEQEAVNLAQKAIEGYMDQFHAHLLSGMRAKLGLFGEEAEDEELIGQLQQLMQTHRADYTNTFRSLTIGELEDNALFGSDDFKEWERSWKARLARQPQAEEAWRALMRANNPSVIPRNHRVEEALEAASERGDLEPMQRLLSALANPYAYAPEQEEFADMAACGVGPYRTFCGT